MSNKDFQYSKEYQQATKTEQDLLDALSDILFEVQYAKMGDKTAMRRKYSLEILAVIRAAYIIHTSGNDLAAFRLLASMDSANPPITEEANT